MDFKKQITEADFIDFDYIVYSRKWWTYNTGIKAPYICTIYFWCRHTNL